MALSMSAFARKQFEAHGMLFCWELKSVNHRYLDATFRMPEAYRYLETSLRRLMRDKLHRGKIECQLRLVMAESDQSSVELDDGRVQAILNVAERMATRYQVANDLAVSQLITWPDVLRSHVVDVALFESEIKDAFAEALLQLLEMRQNEGKHLTQFLASRIESVQESIAQSRKNTHNFYDKTKAKINERMTSLNTEVQDNRVEQEIALLLTRLDVSEELDRLTAHCIEIQSILRRNGPMGKRLDFLMQELNREANTLASKSDSIELTQHAVDMKVLIEQMREQVQNIE